MKRVRGFFVTVCVLTLFLNAAIFTRAAGENRDPYRPVRVELSTPEESGMAHIVRVYQLSPVDDPSGIPTKDFEHGGWIYHMTEMNSSEETGTDTRTVTKTVTKSSETDNMEQILKQMDAEMPVTTDDGYSGMLRLDHTSVMVEAEGYAERNSDISSTRFYPDLNDADLSLIPKTVEENGQILTLDDVDWESGWQTDTESGFIRYSANATYVGTVSTSYPTGYTVTANYTGEVSRSNVEMITYRVDFMPVREVETVEIPPVPENNPAPEENFIPEDNPVLDDNPAVEDEPNTEEIFDTENSNAENLPESPDEGYDTFNEGYETENSGTEAGWTYLPADDGRQSGNWTQEPETSQKNPDYSRLKRTLLSCGLLLFLSVTAYLISKIKQRGGNSS